MVRVSGLSSGASACVVEASESNTYSPLVNDVNTTLFTGSDSDATRTDWLGQGTTSRTMVVGTVPIDNRVYDVLAADGYRYGRGLGSQLCPRQSASRAPPSA